MRTSRFAARTPSPRLLARPDQFRGSCPLQGNIHLKNTKKIGWEKQKQRRKSYERFRATDGCCAEENSHRRRTRRPRPDVGTEAARARAQGRARPQCSAGIGRGIYRGWPDPYPAAQALGRLRARPRSRVRHRHRARQVDLRLIGLGLELFRRSRLHSGPFPGRGAARRLERKQRRLHRHVGCADRQGVDRARRLSPRRPLVMVQRPGALAMDHDRRA